MADVFLSHVEEDGSICEGIARALEAAGYTTWYYERDSLPGTSYLVQTAKEIEQAGVVVLVISPGSIASNQITLEVVRGHECNKPFVPVLRSISHEEFQQRQPEWRQALGAAASIPISDQSLSVALPRIIGGVRALLSHEPGGQEAIVTTAEVDMLHRVTVLCAVVVGAERLAEELPPEEIEALLGECRSAVSRAIEDHGGEPWPEGNDVSGVFGVPVAHEDDPERAARAALRILESIGTLAEDVQAAWGITELAPRVGIDTGSLGADEISVAPEARSYGTIAKRAAILRDAVATGTIGVSEETARSLRARFDLDSIQPINELPILAFRLAGEVEAPGTEDLAPMVDRTAELSVMAESLEELVAGRGQILLIIGKPGIGKSRLLAEVRSRAERRGITWLQGRCLSYGDRLTYWPLVEILRTYLGVAEGEAEVAVRLRLRARTTSVLGAAAADVLPYLARFLSLKLDAEQAEKVRYLPPDALADQIHSAYRKWLLALAGRAPTVIALDDLHWADPSTRALAEALLEAAEEAPVGIVAAFRDDPQSEAWRFRLKVVADYSHRAREIVPALLGEDDASALAGSIVGPEEFDPSALSAILARAEGNPLYIEQLLQSIIEKAREQTGPLDARPALEELPPALEGLLVSRVDQLPQGARRLAQVAAIAGRSFVRRLVDKLVDEGDLKEDLRVLLKAGIIREYKRVPELEYIFTHGLIQDAAASTLAEWRRKQIHGQVAEALVELFAAGIDDYLEIIAHHFAESDDDLRALEYMELAGNKSAALYANEQAIDLWDRARDLAEVLDDKPAHRRITERLAEVLLRIGDERSVTLYRELADDAEGAEESARLFAVAAWSSIDVADDAGAAELVDLGLGVEGASRTARARLVQVRARNSFRPFRGDDMHSALDEVERIAGSELPMELALKQAHLWDLYYSSRGDHAAAREWTERSLELAEQLGDPMRVVEAKHNLGVSLYQAGDLLGEKRLLEEVHESALAMGHVRLIVGAATNLTNVCYLTGDLRLGHKLASDAEEIATDPFMHSLLLVNRSVIERELGEIVTAREDLAKALRLAETADAEEVSIEAGIASAALDIIETEGPERDPEPALRSAIARAREMGEQLPLVAAGHYWLGEFHLRRSDAAQAEQQVRTGLTEARDAGPDHLVPLHRLLGRLQVEDEGRGTLDLALAAARSLGMRLEEGRILATKASLGYLSDNDGGVADARAIFEECGSVRDLAELERTSATTDL